MAKDIQALKGAFNIKKFIKLCFKSWPVFLISVLVCGFFAAVLTVLRPAKEEVFAQLVLKEDTGGSSMLMAGQIARSFSLGDMFGGSSTTDNETFVLKSHNVFLQTAKQMGLNITYMRRPYGILSRMETKNVPYVLTPPDMASDTISRTLTFDIKRLDSGKVNIRVKAKRKVIAQADDQSLPVTMNTPYGNFIINKTEFFDPETTSRKYRILFNSYDGAASAYERLVNIYVPDRKSDFIDLSFVTDDPAFGKDLLNHIISNYIALSNEYKTDRSYESLRLVDDRLSSLAQELVTSEKALETFKQKNKLTDVEVDAQYLMSKTGVLESSLLEAQTNFEVLKLTRDYIKNPENNYSLIPELFVSSSVLSGENGGNLIAQYNRLILDRMELTSTAKGTNSTVKQLDQQIDALRDNIITTIDRQYQNASVALRDIKGETNKNKSRLSELPTIERQYIVLKRDNMLQEQIYLFLLQQREELNMSLASRAVPVQVIDRPYVLPDPAGLSRMMTLALGVFFGVLIALAYVLLIKMRKAPVADKSEIESLLKAPLMCHLANDGDAVDDHTVFERQSANADAIRHLRSDVQLALKNSEGNVAAVTSLHDAEGKTYVAVNLAASLAMTGKRVMLVDAALREPKDATLLGLMPQDNSIADYVTGSGNLRKLTAKVGNFSLDVLASATADSNAADIVANDRFAELIRSLSRDYDYVIIDASRIDGYSDIYTITDIADVTLVVCRCNMVTIDDVERINKMYDEGRLKRIAVVENGF